VGEEFRCQTIINAEMQSIGDRKSWGVYCTNTLSIYNWKSD